MRVWGKGDEVIYVAWVAAEEHVACVSRQRRALICEADDVNLLSGVGKGVKLMRLAPGDELVAAKILIDDQDALIVKRAGGSDYRVSTSKYQPVSRGGKGIQLFKQGKVNGAVYQEPTLPGFPIEEA